LKGYFWIRGDEVVEPSTTQVHQGS
jgi:hypothetical protein